MPRRRSARRLPRVIQFPDSRLARRGWLQTSSLQAPWVRGHIRRALLVKFEETPLSAACPYGRVQVALQDHLEEEHWAEDKRGGRPARHLSSVPAPRSLPVSQFLEAL